MSLRDTARKVLEWYRHEAADGSSAWFLDSGAHRKRDEALDAPAIAVEEANAPQTCEQCGNEAPRVGLSCVDALRTSLAAKDAEIERLKAAMADHLRERTEAVDDAIRVRGAASGAIGAALASLQLMEQKGAELARLRRVDPNNQQETDR